MTRNLSNPPLNKLKISIFILIKYVILFIFKRQFRETAKEMYFKNQNMAHYFHSMIADYFLGIWGGGTPKPFKYTEIQRHR